MLTKAALKSINTMTVEILVWAQFWFSNIQKIGWEAMWFESKNDTNKKIFKKCYAISIRGGLNGRGGGGGGGVADASFLLRDTTPCRR